MAHWAGTSSARCWCCYRRAVSPRFFFESAFLFFVCTRGSGSGSVPLLVVVAYIDMAFIVMAHIDMAYIVMAHIDMAYIITACIVMACVVIVHIVMAYIVMPT